MISAVVTIALVALVPPEQRVEAIMAIPGVLSELLPWSARRPRPKAPAATIPQEPTASSPT